MAAYRAEFDHEMFSFPGWHYMDDEDERMCRSLDWERSERGAADLMGGFYNNPQPSSMGSLETSNGGVKKQQVAASENGSQTDDKDAADVIKTKFLSAWTNVRNGWLVKTSTNFKQDSLIWFLGNVYKLTDLDHKDQKTNSNRSKMLLTSFERFKQDFTSRFWFTYRKEFPKLGKCPMTSDVGWGCMLRCGQMLLAQAFVQHFLKRDWLWNQEDVKNDSIHRQIIQYFGDSPDCSSPFSIHRLVDIGKAIGKQPGAWYGPASISTVLREALLQAQVNDSKLRDLSIHVAMDGTVYMQDIFDTCTYYRSSCGSNSLASDSIELAADCVVSNGDLKQKANENCPSSCSDQTPSDDSIFAASASFEQSHNLSKTDDHGEGESTDDDSNWKSLILIIPLRLGSEVLNDIYIPCLKALLSDKMCIGIIGGRPKHSLYFVGYQDEKLIHLDPHCCQDTIDVSSDNFSFHSFHCQFPRKLAFSKMDPTCAIGFYCRTREDLLCLRKTASKIAKPPHLEGYPMFQFLDSRKADFHATCLSADESLSMSPQSHGGRSTNEDFTFL